MPNIKDDFHAILFLWAGRHMENCSQIYNDLLDMFLLNLCWSCILGFKRHRLDLLYLIGTIISLIIGLWISKMFWIRWMILRIFLLHHLSPLFRPSLKINKLQSFVFDYIFPFWFKSGADFSETRSMIIWYICAICSYSLL